MDTGFGMWRSRHNLVFYQNKRFLHVSLSHDWEQLIIDLMLPQIISCEKLIS